MIVSDPACSFIGLDGLSICPLKDPLKILADAFDHFLFHFRQRPSLKLDPSNRHRTSHIHHIAGSIEDLSRTKPFSIFRPRKLIVGRAGNYATLELMD